jgi:hypothetical protein
MILKILLLGSGITLAIQDYKERKVNTILSLGFILVTCAYLSVSITFTIALLLLWLYTVLVDKPIDNCFLFLTVFALMTSHHLIPNLLTGTLLWYIFSGEEKVPFILVCNILILLAVVLG